MAGLRGPSLEHRVDIWNSGHALKRHGKGRMQQRAWQGYEVLAWKGRGLGRCGQGLQSECDPTAPARA